MILLRAGENLAGERRHAAEHERFIDSLIKRNLILLGGGFTDPIRDARAAYVLRCGDVDEARRIAESDPLIAHGVFRPEVTEWQLVGINPDAIDQSAVVKPADV